MTDLTAYRSTHPDVLAVIEKWRADMEQWHTDSAALLKELGFTDRSFMVCTSMGHRWISGIEYHGGDPIPTGWRTWKDNGGQTVLTPHKGRKAGKEAQEKIQTCKVPNLPQASLPGMPGDRICNGGWRSPGLREMAGAVYVTWAAEALPEIPASGPEREAHLGDDEHDRKIRLANDVDLAFWERLKLSEYYAAVEAADEAFIDMAQANGGLTRSAERLTYISRIMSALRGHDTPHRVSYNRIRTEMRAEADQLRTERDAAQQRLDHLADLARTVDHETTEAYIVHDSITDLINACTRGGESK